MSRALFLDRDGTLVAPRHYPSEPGQLALAPGIGPRLRMFQDAGWELIVVTNQTGVAGGLFSDGALERRHEHLRDLLRVWGVELDAIQACPHHVDGDSPRLAIACDCRKPKPGMLLQTAHQRGIELTRSWVVSDFLDDVEAGNRAGCQTVLVDLGTERLPTTQARWPRFVARSIAEALDLIAFTENLRPSPGPPSWYRPSQWYSAAAMQG